MTKEKLSLSIDTSVGNGSFSLWNEKNNLYSLIGDEFNSRSSDILNIISKILLETNKQKERIGEIIFTIGPGSYTGLRVGIASVLGLGVAIDSDMFPISVFEAYTVVSKGYEICYSSKLLSSSKIFVQEFSKKGTIFAKVDPYVIDTKKILNHLQSDRRRCLVVDKIGFQKLKRSFKLSENFDNIICASDNASILAYEFFIKNKQKIQTSFIPIYGRDFSSK